jgi:methylthioribose-1-phosphate isomerase
VPDHDASRRAFFRQFGRQAVTTVGQVAGLADMVNRASGVAAAGLLGLGEPSRSGPGGRSPATSPRRSAGLSAVRPTSGDDHYRSPYRLEGDALVLLDQRGIPERLGEVVARRASDVAYYLRLGVCRGGALMAQVAAYGMALSAAERIAGAPAALDMELRRSSRALVEARPSARLLRWGVARMEGRRAELAGSDGVAIAAALRAEADAIASELQTQQAAIATALVEGLSKVRDGPLGVLVHGDPGALAGGLVGTGITALQRLHDDGRELRVFVTETRPFMEGARLAAWELRQAGIVHKVIPDAAVAWLFEREPIDAVLVGGEWLAANGDSAAVVGSRAVAQQSAAAPDRAEGGRPRVIVCAVCATVDPGAPDGAAIPAELRPPREQTTYLADVRLSTDEALVPANDVIPAELIWALVTERGMLGRPDASAIAALLDSPASSASAEGSADAAAGAT